MSESPTTNQTGKLDAIFIINIVSLMLTFISTVILGLKLRMKCCCGEISMKGKDNTSKDSPSPPTTTATTTEPPAEVEMPATESHMRGRSRTTKRRSLERRSNSLEKEKTQEDDEQEEAEEAVAEAPVESPAATKMPLTPETGSTASKKKRPSSVIIKQGGAEVIVEIVQPSPPATASGLQQTEKC